MLTFENALDTVLSSARPLGSERVDIADASNRILAENVKSDMNIPPFNKSAMDGYACRRMDLANELTVIETIPAGYVPTKALQANQCSKIMTGGMVPKGADCVIMKEYVETIVEYTVRFVGEQTKDNICRQAEDIKAGDIVLRKGTIISSQHIAVLASVGNTQPLVAAMPKIGVIATGDELVEPASQPGPSQIRNSNSFQLAAQIGNAGAIATNYGIARDATNLIDSAFKKAARENNVVIISGGVSVGDFDFVPEMLRRNNIDLLFEKIAVKPGKPTVFGVSQEIYCFGLPGNPVSTFVLFEVLVKPFIYKLMGHVYKPLNVRMPMGERVTIKKAKRQRWLPVTITNEGTVKLVEYHGSAHISSLCSADGLISVDVGVTEVKADVPVSVRLI